MMLSEAAPSAGRDETVLLAPRKAWSAVGAMSLCVALLIAAEFLPVSLLTPIAADMKTTIGLTGQAISISGLFAIIASLLTASVAGRFDRRRVLLFLTAVMLVSVGLIGQATNFTTLMVARALLGVTIGGFWSLSTAVVMRLVPTKDVPKALGLLYLGNALATALAAPIGSSVGGIIGWRGVFNALVPLILVNLVWQWLSLPSLPVSSKTEIRKVVGLLGRRHVAFAMGAINAAIPVTWSTWLASGVADEPEAGGGLMVAVIQLAITAGAAFGGLLLDRWSAPFALIGGSCLLVCATLVVGSGSRLRKSHL